MSLVKHTPTIKSKLPKTGTTIFTVMSELANKHDAINLSQGFPDFNCSKKLIELVNNYMKKGNNQYAPMQGLMSLREKIALKTEELYDAKYNPETEITITAGGTQALYTAISTVIHEGDEAIVFEPAYDSYIPAIELAGGRPVFVSLTPPDYSIDWNKVMKLITPRTRLIIINSPHNPTGTILTKKDMDKLVKITEGNEIFILSDEVYEHIIFDGLKHESICNYPKLRDRSFIVFSFGKTYHATGWKIGYCLAPAELTKEFRKVHQFVTFCVNTPIQYALSDYMDIKDEYLGLSDFYQTKRNHFISLLDGSKFEIIPSKGTYFQLLGYSKITDEKDIDFAKRLCKVAGVASVPTTVFYHEPLDYKMLRFCFAKEKSTLELATERLLKWHHDA